MDEKTAILIRELAEKFGTTGEHLWGVLVRQAPISGITDLLVVSAWIVLSLVGFKFVLKQTTCPPETEADRYPSAAWEDEGAFSAWAGWSVFTAIVMVAGGCGLSTIVGALINPEYWALKQLLP